MKLEVLEKFIKSWDLFTVGEMNVLIICINLFRVFVDFMKIFLTLISLRDDTMNIK